MRCAALHATFLVLSAGHPPITSNISVPKAPRDRHLLYSRHHSRDTHERHGTMATSTTAIHAASNSGQGQDGQVAPMENTTITASPAVAAQDETPAADGLESQPDGEVWFEDGNLILIDRRVEFRVYKGPLVANSPVFEDLLSLPQSATNPSGQSPAFKCTCGSTTALLHVEDSPEDLRHLLRAIMPGKTPRWVFRISFLPRFAETGQPSVSGPTRPPSTRYQHAFG
ncbi:hypothetical protein NUW54_g4616 [Trametes sanguinea]|uniref:Uncharacterized protein n=1 Tax=Trametes sanguinea TaxID=158606 RepID=A0ACC1PZ99_9APHY|nr:hypothetical protein NUW54_g4616 [Trametes sanguinea]